MENPTEQELQEQESSFTCEICIEPVDSNQRFNPSGINCSHDSYCVECIAKYIEAKIEQHNTSNIQCPGADCKQSLDPLTCRSILSSRVFDLWCDTLSEASLSHKGCYRSYCPYPDCSTAYFSECNNIFGVKCLKCERKFCFKCKIPWDVGHDCSNYRDREGINDSQFESLVAEMKWARCPECGHVVERKAGCPAITCRCGTMFCYNSGKMMINYSGCKCVGCQAKVRRILARACCLTCGFWFLELLALLGMVYCVIFLVFYA
ncbi:RBR-type E3 ubiquitin transferase [Ranunculus cassubicifolius]